MPPKHGSTSEHWKHIDYEANQLAACAMALLSKEIDCVTRNAFLESTLVHIRCLAAFLWSKHSGDDMDPKDFLSTEWPIPDAAPIPLKRLNKELSHLSYKRRDSDDPGRKWDLHALAKIVLSALNGFYRLAGKPFPPVACEYLAMPENFTTARKDPTPIHVLTRTNMA